MPGPSRASSIRRGSKFCTIWRYWRVQISILKPDSATNHVKHISEKCTGLLRPGPCWAWAGLPQPTPEAFFLQPLPATLFLLLLSSSFPVILFDFVGNVSNKITPQRPLILFECFLEILKQNQGKNIFRQWSSSGLFENHTLGLFYLGSSRKYSNKTGGLQGVILFENFRKLLK